jgi:DedD protein
LNQQLKQRVVGAIVLISVAVIFVPALLDGSHKNVSPLIEREIPQKPNFYFEDIKLPASVDAGEPPTRIIEDKQDLVETPPVKPSSSASREERRVEQTAEPSSKSSSEVVEPPAAWVVQIASLTNSKRAFELKEQLNKAGFVAFVEETVSDGKKFYRVRVGPELKQEEAQSLQQSIKQKIKLDSSVMRYHPL